MGGLGSGRRKNRVRKTVESYCMLDVNQLSQKGPAAPVPANGPTATRLFQLTSVLRLSGCVFPMPSGPGTGDEKTLSIPSPSSICVVGSAAAAPISSAPDLEAALNAGGA